MNFMTRIEHATIFHAGLNGMSLFEPKPGFVDYIHLVVKAVADALTATTMFANLKPTALR
jgi:hypothetical protein